MQKIKVNLIPSGLPVACYSSQYDEGRVIRCELYNGLQPYTLQENDVVTLNLRKPDNHVVTATLNSTAGNKYVDLVTSEQMTAVFGVNKCLLKITNTGIEVGTAEFLMFVQKDVIANGDPSESVIEGLDEQVTAIALAEVQEILQDYSIDYFPSDKYWQDNALYKRIFRTVDGIRTDFDVSELKPANGKTYFIAPNGNDSNTGEDKEHPLQKLSTAIAKEDVNTIIVMDGIYNLGRVGGSFTKGVNIIADENAKPVFVMSRDKTWSATAGKTNVYQTTDSANTYYGVVRLNARDNDGDFINYTLVASIDDVETTENSYYVSDHDIYIHSENTPQKVYVLVSGVNVHATLSNGETLYIEGCEFVGGNYGGVRVTNGGTAKPLVLLKNCGFSHSYLGNAMYLQGCSGIIQNCYASYGASDGFNYHLSGDAIPDSIEINCIGRHNGTEGNNTNNGSTMHDGGKIIRLNCEYFDNIGPNLADVSESTRSYNYGVVSHDSAGASTNKTGFQCQMGTMYNDTCASYNNGYEFQVYNGGELRQKNCSGAVTVLDTAKLRAY